MGYTVNVARQVLRDAEEEIFYKKELGTYPENIEKFEKDLDKLIYIQLSENPLIGTKLSFRLYSVSTTIRYLVVDDYILFMTFSKIRKLSML